MSKLEDRLREGVSSRNLIEQLSLEMFVERWTELVGEPPATMLESRREMLRLLIESLPVESMTPISDRLPPSCFGSKARY